MNKQGYFFRKRFMYLKLIVFFCQLSIIFLFINGCVKNEEKYIDGTLIGKERDSKVEISIYYRDFWRQEFGRDFSLSSIRDDYDYYVNVNAFVFSERQIIIDRLQSIKLPERIKNVTLKTIALCEVVISNNQKYAFALGTESNIVWINGKFYNVDIETYTNLYGIVSLFMPWEMINHNK